MMRRIIAAALVAAALPLAAGADTCPTAGDVETGVRLTRLDPFFSILLTQTPDGLAEARIAERDGVPDAVSSFYAHPLAVTRRIGSNGTLELRYGDDTRALDDLPALREWSTTVELVADGDVVNRGTYTARVDGFGEAMIDTCNYDVWRVRDTLALDGSAPLFFEKAYAPDLGLIVSSIRLAADGNPINGVFFDEITAE